MSSNPALVAHSYMFIGLAVNIWLYGIMTTQVYLYYKDYPKRVLLSASPLKYDANSIIIGNRDKIWLKALVAALTLADTLNTVFLFVYLYNSLILHYNDPPYLGDPDWIFATDPALTSHPVAAILTAVDVVKSTSFEEFRKFKTLVIIWLAAEALGDLTITGILVTYLDYSDWVRYLAKWTASSIQLCAIKALRELPDVNTKLKNGLAILYNGFSLEVTSDAPTLSDERSQLSSMPPMRFNTRPLEIFTSSESHEFRDADYPIIPSRSLGGGGVIKRKISQNGHDSPSINSGECSGEIHGTKRVSAAETLVGDPRV
ncbi:hypothetical protein ONZ45_g2856 [Pleurotus djamor]|nr:hypothetical protein ONZ45_g2856 [Pleurotus djamor]